MINFYRLLIVFASFCFVLFLFSRLLFVFLSLSNFRDSLLAALPVSPSSFSTFKLHKDLSGLFRGNRFTVCLSFTPSSMIYADLGRSYFTDWPSCSRPQSVIRLIQGGVISQSLSFSTSSMIYAYFKGSYFTAAKLFNVLSDLFLLKGSCCVALVTLQSSFLTSTGIYSAHFYSHPSLSFRIWPFVALVTSHSWFKTSTGIYSSHLSFPH